jgi:hypothetical protein
MWVKGEGAVRPLGFLHDPVQDQLATAVAVGRSARLSIQKDDNGYATAVMRPVRVARGIPVKFIMTALPINQELRAGLRFQRNAKVLFELRADGFEPVAK